MHQQMHQQLRLLVQGKGLFQHLLVLANLLYTTIQMEYMGM